MIINIRQINEKGVLFKDVTSLSNTFLVEEESFFLEDTSYNIMLKKSQERINARGWLKTVLSLRCVRCLEHFDFPINSKFDLMLFNANHFEPGERVLEEDDMEYIFFNDEEIDLEKILIEQINFSIPLHPLCSKNCKGICPTCGCNLNNRNCECEKTKEFSKIYFKKS